MSAEKTSGGVLELIHNANQRGGRMLSVLDLLDAETLEIRLAAWLLERILSGSSWLVGARPGGAGKTTIMCALLAMLPAGVQARLVGGGNALASTEGGTGSPVCLVAYEISPGPYRGYIWGEEVKRFVRAASPAVRIVSNLHADTLADARRLVVEENGLTEEDLCRFGLFLPIELRVRDGITVPAVPRVMEANAAGEWREISRLPSARRGERRRAIEQWLAGALTGRRRRIEEVRAAWLTWLNEGTVAGSNDPRP